jgi:hypothetical protein
MSITVGVMYLIIAALVFALGSIGDLIGNIFSAHHKTDDKKMAAIAICWLPCLIALPFILVYEKYIK